MSKINYNEIEQATRPKFLKPFLLAHPPLPKPVHGLNPRTIKGQKWWDEKRFEAQEKNNFHCWSCGVHKSEAHYHQWLEGHESYLIDYKNGRMELEEIVSLCHCCHNYIHSGLLQIKLAKRQIDEDKYNFIINHGNELVKDLPAWKFPDEKDICKDYSKWHLVIDGKKYFSNFKNEQEWQRHYNNR